MNNSMGHDPRAISNAILDIADRLQLGVTNLSLNKILFFAHAHWLSRFRQRLSSLSFEAWQYGPVVPLIYHQFKHHGNNSICSRATTLDLDTGDDVIVSYSNIEFDYDFLEAIVSEYGNYSPGKLVQLSHIPGGAWDHVWNSSPDQKFGMVIPDSLIAKTFDGSIPRSPVKRYVH